MDVRKLRLWDVVPQRVAVERLGGGEGRRRWLQRNFDPVFKLGGVAFYLADDLGLSNKDGGGTATKGEWPDFPNYRLVDLRTRKQMERQLRRSHQWVWMMADVNGGPLRTVNPWDIRVFYVDDGTQWPKRCWAEGQKGRCKRKLWGREKYCWQHRGLDDA